MTTTTIEVFCMIDSEGNFGVSDTEKEAINAYKWNSSGFGDNTLLIGRKMLRLTAVVELPVSHAVTQKIEATTTEVPQEQTK
jgi:hypothetical protein